MLPEQRYGLMVELVLTFDFTFVRSLYGVSFVLWEKYALIMTALLFWFVLGCSQSCFKYASSGDGDAFCRSVVGFGVICFKRISKSCF